MSDETIGRFDVGRGRGANGGLAHADVEETTERLACGPEGLSERHARARLDHVGPNRLTATPRVSALRILLDQFASLVVGLLIAAAAVALLLGDLLESVAIGAVLAINALIGFVVELRARRAMDALLAYEVPIAKVVRSGHVQTIPSDRLVPGDVIELEEGDRIPADARLLSSIDLTVNESPLTGESLPVAKSVDSEVGAADAHRSPIDHSMVYSGTSVYVGRATALVVNTGARTELGPHRRPRCRSRGRQDTPRGPPRRARVGASYG